MMETYENETMYYNVIFPPPFHFAVRIIMEMFPS